MADGRAEDGAARVAHGEQRDFIIEIDKAFDNDARLSRAPARLGIAPDLRDIGVRVGRALPLSRRRHDGL